MGDKQIKYVSYFKTFRTASWDVEERLLVWRCSLCGHEQAMGFASPVAGVMCEACRIVPSWAYITSREKEVVKMVGGRQVVRVRCLKSFAMNKSIIVKEGEIVELSIQEAEACIKLGFAYEVEKHSFCLWHDELRLDAVCYCGRFLSRRTRRRMWGWSR